MDEGQNRAAVHELPPQRKSPRERFLEVAPKRTQKVLDAVRLLGRCGNRVTYGYEKEEAAKIIKAIKDEVARMEARFDDNQATKFEL